MVKRDVHYRFSEPMIEALNELFYSDKPKETKSESRTALIEYLLANYLKTTFLWNNLHRLQLDLCITPDGVFQLFVMFCKAKRKVKGYKFAPGPMTWKGDKEPTPDEIKKFMDNPANRVVLGPPPPTPFDNMS